MLYSCNILVPNPKFLQPNHITYDQKDIIVTYQKCKSNYYMSKNLLTVSKSDFLKHHFKVVWLMRNLYKFMFKGNKKKMSHIYFNFKSTQFTFRKKSIKKL